jgi:hypothetical protein
LRELQEKECSRPGGAESTAGGWQKGEWSRGNGGGGIHTRECR